MVNIVNRYIEKIAKEEESLAGAGSAIGATVGFVTSPSNKKRTEMVRDSAVKARSDLQSKGMKIPVEPSARKQMKLTHPDRFRRNFSNVVKEPTSRDLNRAAVRAAGKTALKTSPSFRILAGAVLGSAAGAGISAAAKKMEKKADEERDWDKAGPYSRADLVISGAIPAAIVAGLSGAGASHLHNLRTTGRPLRTGRIAAATSVLGALVGGIAGNKDFRDFQGATDEEMATLESAYQGKIRDSLPVDNRAVKIARKDMQDAIARERAKRFLTDVLDEYKTY